MIFSEKLQILRKNKGYTQEALADKLGVSRQAVAKWESGQIYPDISNLIQISELMNVSVDYLVKDQNCTVNIEDSSDTDLDELVAFRLEANVNTYAAFMNETDSTRPSSHDFRYENGNYMYHDTYVGGEKFAGEEAIWKNGVSVYAMNYMGRVLADGFSGNFLKEALRAADKKCRTEDLISINPVNTLTDVMSRVTLRGSRDMKRSIKETSKYMNVYSTEVF